MLQEYVRFIWVFYWKFLYISNFTLFWGDCTPLINTFFLKFDSARLQTITYLPTEFQAGSFNTLDFYKETDGPTDRKGHQSYANATH